jgi:hypothetical protein
MVTLPGQSTPIAQQAQVGGSASFAYIACSGSETVGVTDKSVFSSNSNEQTYNLAGNTDWGYVQGQAPWSSQSDVRVEGMQDTQGALSSSTTLVTLSVGGNDIRFADVLTGCLLTITDCISSNYKLTRNSNGFVDPDILTNFEPTVIGLLGAHLEAVYKQIHSLARDAEIVVLGYPDLFPSNPQSSCLVGLGLSMNAGDQNWLNQMGDLLNLNIQNAVNAVKGQGVDIKFINPTPYFAGHEICAAAPWINGLILWSNSGQRP